jgi:hypothetical protein
MLFDDGNHTIPSRRQEHQHQLTAYPDLCQTRSPGTREPISNLGRQWLVTRRTMARVSANASTLLPLSHVYAPVWM